MRVTRVLEQKWQEWVTSRSSGTPTVKQSACEASVARDWENMARKMSMLEPSLKDLAELKGR
eukprot:11614800-Prorocentrum_lima.AAC.1